MKKLFYFVIIACCLTGMLKANTSPDNTKLLNQLDNTIKNRKKYRTEKENQINDLHSSLRQASTDEERFDIYSRLYDACIAYQTDSALRYINEKSALLSTLIGDRYYYDVELNRVNVMIITGMYKEALDVLDSIPQKKLSENLKERYLHCYRTLYGRMANHAVTKQEKDRYLDYTDNYRDSLLAILPPDGTDYMITKADQLNIHGQYDEAIRLIKGMTDTCTNMERMRFLAYTLSESYHQKGDKENREHYLILSAIADLQYSIKEYISLRELTFLLYEEGDIDRAYEYMKCSLEDATFCNARSRTIEVSEIFPVIDKAYQLKSERKQKIIYSLLWAISILALCLIVTVIYIYRQIKKLAAVRRAVSDSNKQLQALNQTLTETNIIKEEYIAQYISRCSVYIDKIDQYRKKLIRLASTSKLEELYKTIKSDKLIDDERKEFYKEFDHTFLGIFPDFVKSFNELLNENDRIYPKNGELLNTELRIFALIRLGITDSTRIAEFLQYSVTTIYNYRSKIRNKAAGDKNEFESKIMMIK
ncbi:MAG: DUF6377 domain-containing protein [Tannerella sp.]|jgi:cell division protein FtsB|nr:DUF6377 domain-containing protein [Tannerella sp.]